MPAARPVRPVLGRRSKTCELTCRDSQGLDAQTRSMPVTGTARAAWAHDPGADATIVTAVAELSDGQ